MDAPDQIITLAEQKGIVLANDIAMLGIPATYLSRLVERGALQRIGRGVYMLPDHQVTENHTLAVVCAQVPAGVICLLSALRFHNLTTQLPFQVWMALKKHAWKPTIEDVSMRYFWFSGPSYTEGIESHQVEGINVNVYSPAKTVADCFKFRNRLGTDIAVEALRDGLQHRHFTIDELWHYAKICRVQSVITPYIEAIL